MEGNKIVGPQQEILLKFQNYQSAKRIVSGGRGLRFDSRNSFSKCLSIFCCENFSDLFVLVDLVLAPRPLVQHRALQPHSALPPFLHLQHTDQLLEYQTCMEWRRLSLINYKLITIAPPPTLSLNNCGNRNTEQGPTVMFFSNLVKLTGKTIQFHDDALRHRIWWRYEFCSEFPSSY